MTDDVALGQTHHGDVGHGLQSSRDVRQARDARQQVRLLRIACDHHGRMPAQAGQQHLELDVGAVLRLVHDDEGVVQRAAAHIADRGDLDQTFGHQRLDPLHRQTIGQGVVERAQIGSQLVLHVAGQEADGFAGLDGRTAQDDAADLARLQRLDRLGDGEVGLARACRTQRHDQIVVVDSLHQFALALGLGLQRLQIALFAVVVRRIGRPS